MADMKEIERITLHEYDLRLTAYRLKQADKSRDMHLMAWFSRDIEATNKKGDRYQYEKFEDFFDMETEERRVLGLGEKTVNEKYDKQFIDIFKN